MAWFLSAILFGDVAFNALAASKDKELVAHIQCAVCKQAVKEASLKVKEDNIEEEDVITDLVDVLCSSGKDEGKWITKIDIWRKGGQDDAQLALDRRDEEGVCKNECKLVQRACSAALKKREDTLATMLKDRAGVGKLQREVCKKSCEKAIPKLGEWKDEAFEPLTPKPTMPPPPEPPADESIPSPDPVDKFSPVFSDVVASALAEMGSMPTVDEIVACYAGPAASEATKLFLEEMTAGAEDILKKDLEAMRSGLARLGKAFAALAEKVQELCEQCAQVASKMKVLGEHLVSHCSGNDTSAIEYTAMELLKVGGRDIHKLLNTLLGAWKQDPVDGKALGQALAKLFKVFDSDEVTDGKNAEL